jgi:Putative peptidoglycan binding domain
MKPIDEVELRKLILSTNSPPSDEIAFLHALLNHHLGPPDDQLPIAGSGSRDFGPRTKAKVQRFQQANKIDVGTRSFKDGIVGPDTWEVLLEKQQITVNIIATPQLKLTPPTFPPTPPAPVPQPPVIPVPKLTLNVQLQAGEQGTLPTQGAATASHTIQLVAVLLNKNNKDVTHLEGQIGPQIAFNRGGGRDPDNSKTDLGFVAALVANNLKGSGGRFTWSIQAQTALNKSLTNSSASGQGAIIGQANLSVVQNDDKDDVLQVTTQVGGFLTAEAPNDNNGDKWKLTGGAVLFFGVTGTFNNLGSF